MTSEESLNSGSHISHHTVSSQGKRIKWYCDLKEWAHINDQPRWIVFKFGQFTLYLFVAFNAHLYHILNIKFSATIRIVFFKVRTDCLLPTSFLCNIHSSYTSSFFRMRVTCVKWELDIPIPLLKFWHISIMPWKIARHRYSHIVHQLTIDVCERFLDHTSQINYRFTVNVPRSLNFKYEF